MSAPARKKARAAGLDEFLRLALENLRVARKCHRQGAYTARNTALIQATLALLAATGLPASNRCPRSASCVKPARHRGNCYPFKP